VIELYFIECVRCITIHKWGVPLFICPWIELV
jgi:hypothetical protein